MAKTAEPWNKTRKKQSDAILRIQYSGGTGTSSCLVSKTTNNKVKDKKQTIQ